MDAIPLSSNKPTSSLDNRLRWLFNKTGNFLDRFLHWLPEQTSGFRRALYMIGIFALINILFTGIADPWFIFPSAPFALYILLKLRGKK